MKSYYHFHETPIGLLLLAGDGEFLTLLGFPHGPMKRAPQRDWVQASRPFVEVIGQLDEYFAGARKSFNLPLRPRGTEFQHKVWQALQHIPFGDTWSYGELASYLNKPRALRAVGAANGLNPIPIIIPCHRVIGSNGKLTGFGGGLEMKAYLLNLEASHTAPCFDFA